LLLLLLPLPIMLGCVVQCEAAKGGRQRILLQLCWEEGTPDT